MKIRKGHSLFGTNEVKLQKLYQLAEKKIVDEIVKQNKNGNIDFTNIENNAQINKILNRFIEYTNQLAPDMVKQQFLIGRKKAKLPGIRVPEQYDSSLAMLAEQLEGKTINARNVIKSILKRRWKQCVLDNKSDLEKASESFVKEVKNKGITSFVDRTGKNWTLQGYFGMASRTLALQAMNLGSLSDTWDLYKMSSHPTACPICKQYQGRVYSKSGMNPKYPPLASIFGKIDPNGPDVLENTYLCIHPNCLHKLYKFKESGVPLKQLKELQAKSSFSKNPPKLPKKSEEELKEYREQVEVERRLKKQYNEFLKKQAKNFEKNIQFNISLG